jgi:hypothetical protein
MVHGSVGGVAEKNAKPMFSWRGEGKGLSWGGRS